jgi:hypothetical protein
VLIDALQKFKNPENPEDPLQAYQPFKDIFKALIPYTKPSTLKLNSISPELSKMISSVIPVPGLHLQVITQKSNFYKNFIEDEEKEDFQSLQNQIDLGNIG